MAQSKENPSSNTTAATAGHALAVILCCFALIIATPAVNLLSGSAAAGIGKQQLFGLPELHKINSATLQPSYSCRSHEDFHKGYERTALFVSTFSQNRNSPEVLFNGACGATDYFENPGGGDSMGLIEDLGKVRLEEVTAQSVFTTRDVYFERHADVQIGHTYAVLLNEADRRGLVVFTVTGYVPNEKVDLKYAVKEYQLLNIRTESPGFDWGKGSPQ